MKTLSTIIAAGAIALTLSSSALAGPVGVSRTYATQPDPQTISELQQASDAAQREARNGNKDNLAERTAGRTGADRRCAAAGTGLVTRERSAW